MFQIKTKIDQLRRDKSPKITQDKLEEYGLAGRTLRAYQLDGLDFIRKCYSSCHGCILGDEMGLGKTIQVISSLIFLKGSKSIDGPFLILCPLSVLDNWKSELERFASPLKVAVLIGDKNEREVIKQQAHNSRSNICIREVSFLSSFHWRVLAIDEAHRLKNSKSLLHQELSRFRKDFSILLTGTPVQNNLKELYSLLSFVAPEIFEDSFEDEFLETFSDLNTSYSDKSKDLQSLLSPFLLRRVKAEVMKDLPQKTEVILYAGMTDLQKKYYKGILTKDLGVFSSDSGNRTALNNILVRLRQCVNHPYLFDGVEPEPFVLGDHLITASGKLCILDKLLTFLRKGNHKVLMFSQMTRMLDILQDYLGYAGFTYERLDGSVRGEERYLAIRNFNEVEDTFVFLLSTKAGGQGLNLTSADTVIFVDSDYNPQNDLQAAARAHRLGQTRPVKIIRLVARNTVEEIILKRADDKLKLTNSVIEGGQLADILKFGLDKLFDTDEKILGKTQDGKWIVERTTVSKKEENTSETETSSMYVYEGHDYSRVTTDSDKKAFDKMVADMLEEVTSSERSSRRLGKALQPNVLDLPSRKRKVLTEEELEERRKKKEESAAKRAKLKEEKELMKEEARKKRLEELWKENNYNSLNVVLDDSDDEEHLTDDDDHRTINYVRGDVTKPIVTTGNPSIIVHCVDDSGYWGKGGLFTVISRRSSSCVQSYELAGSMEDLHLGDAHLIPFEDEQQNPQHNTYLLLIVAQTRDKHHRLLPIDLSALSKGLERAHQAARNLDATVHLPRIGHTTPGFNWYGTERLIRKHLASRGIPTNIYYYSNTQKATTSRPELSSSGSSSDEHQPSSSLRNRKVSSDESYSASSGEHPSSSIRRQRKSKLRHTKAKEDYEFSDKIEVTSGKLRSLLSCDLSDNSDDEPTSSSRLQSAKNIRRSSTISENSSDESEGYKQRYALNEATSEKRSETRRRSKRSRLLPDVFNGVRIFFKDIDKETTRKMRRYVIAYNGDVETLLCDDVTHVVCDVKAPPVKEKLGGKVVIVTIRWLEDCIKKQKLLDTVKYLV